MEGRKPISRRKALKLAGLAAAPTGLGIARSARGPTAKDTSVREALNEANDLQARVDEVIVGGQKDYHAVLKYREWLPTSLEEKLRGKDIDNERLHEVPSVVWKNFLEDRGYKVKLDRMFLPFQQDGISAQRVEDIRGEGLKGTLGGVLGWNSNEISFTHNFRLRFTEPTARSTTQCGDEGLEEGEDPHDTSAISWYDPCYRLKNTENFSENAHTSEYVSIPEAKITRSSAGYKVDDRAWFEDEAYDDSYDPCRLFYSSYQSAEIDLVSTKHDDSDCDTNSETSVLAAYSHTYSGSISDYSVSAGLSPAGPTIGISYGSGSTVEEVTTKHGADTNTWEVSMDEVTT